MESFQFQQPVHVFSSVPTVCMIFCPCWSVRIQAWWHQRKTFIWTLCDPTVPNMSRNIQSTGVMATEVLRYAALWLQSGCSLFAQIRSELPVWKVNTRMWNPVAFRGQTAWRFSEQWKVARWLNKFSFYLTLDWRVDAVGVGDQETHSDEEMGEKNIWTEQQSSPRGMSKHSLRNDTENYDAADWAK